MSIDLRTEFADEKWFASCYFDDERCGIVTAGNTIVLGVGHGFSYGEAKQIVDEHNAELAASAERMEP